MWDNSTLAPWQAAAVSHVASNPTPPREESRAVNLLGRWQNCQAVLARMGTGMLTINFHPDRPARRAGTVLESVAESGHWLNQFETATTNGFALWEKSGVRVRRESAVFGGAYDGKSSWSRPKYGGLNLFENPRGAWPRFGSSHWVLHESVLGRTTLTVPGSCAERSWSGVINQFSRLLPKLVLQHSTRTRIHRFPLIDGAVEIQVHGPVSLETDIVGLVLDPSFRGTNTEATATRVCSQFNMAFSWAPELSNSGHDWKFAFRRKQAAELIRTAVESQEEITAFWIGKHASAERESAKLSGSKIDATCRYLWNRLLLNQRQNQVLPTAADDESSDASGRSR